MLSDDLGEKKKIFTKGLEFLDVVSNVIEKRGTVFLPLVFASLYKDAARKTKWFFCIHNIIYFENKAKLSGKTTGHC